MSRKLEAVKDDGRAAHAAGQRRPAQLNAAGNLNLQITNEEPPPRGSLFFWQRDVASCGFAFGRHDIQSRLMPLAVPPLFKRVFWVSKRKVRFNRQKFLKRSIEGTSRGIEEKFCVSTLEKEGTPRNKKDSP